MVDLSVALLVAREPMEVASRWSRSILGPNPFGHANLVTLTEPMLYVSVTTASSHRAEAEDAGMNEVVH